MGAYVADVFSRMLGKGVGEDAFKEGVSKLEGNSLGRGFLNLAGNKDYELDLHPGGQAIKAMNEDYVRIHDQTLGQEVKKINPTDPAPVREQQMRAAKGTARLTAVANVYGPHYENATPIIARMLTDKDPRVVMNGHRVADIISNQVKDTQDITSFGKGVVSQAPGSLAKASMNDAFITANKFAKNEAIMDFKKSNELDKLTKDQIKNLKYNKIPLLDTGPTYEKQSQAEYAAHKIMNTQLIPFVAINHIGQLFHIPADSPLPAIGAMLLRQNQQHADAIIEMSHITASTLWNEMYSDIQAETGKVSQWTKSPTVGKILGRMIHQPGFNWSRKLSLNMAGTVGFHSAIYWARDFADTQSERAGLELDEMGIGRKDVMKQGGKLNDEQLTRGVYHYVNNRFFMNRSIDDSLYMNRNIVYRSMFMYHSFVNSEASYMRRTLIKMYKARDIAGLAQYAGTLGVLFPNVAPLISGAEVLARTGSPTQAKQEVQSRYKRLYEPSSIGDWASNYIALLAHIGAAGVYFSYAGAIQAHRLMSAVAGPLLGAGTEDIEDAWNATFNPTHNVKPLERDALKQTLPVVGSALAHHLAPTTAEQQSQGSGNSHRSRFSARRRRF